MGLCSLSSFPSLILIAGGSLAGPAAVAVAVAVAAAVAVAVAWALVWLDELGGRETSQGVRRLAMKGPLTMTD